MSRPVVVITGALTGIGRATALAFARDMHGEYEPSPSDRVREQVELYEATNVEEGGTLNGKRASLC